MSQEPILHPLRKPPDELTQHECLWLTHRLGDLAYWWLRPEVLAKASGDLVRLARWSLEPRPNGCAILYALTDTRQFPAFREAFLLPLQWAWETSDDSRLPDRVRQLAENIRQQLAHAPSDDFRKKADFSRWGLQLAVHIGNANILHTLAAELQLSPNSGWGWLCASLIAAEQIRQTQENNAPSLRHDVWISAEWNDGSGIDAVGCLEEKLRAASWPQSGVKIFFVPESQIEYARQLLPEQSLLTIQGLPQGKSDPVEALRPCLLELEVPPPPDGPIIYLQAYYERLYSRNTDRAKQYYRQQLLPRVIERLRQQWQEKNGTISHLVTILSDNPELVHIAIESTGASRCLVLATSDKRAAMRELEEMRASAQRPCEVIWKIYKSTDELLRELEREVHTFVQGVPAELVGLDLTPGTKEMTLTLALRVAQPEHRLLYLRHERKRQMVVPFTEQWILYNPRRP
jgi:hypothetical protein